jgi:ketosteroid isomerase-like protein
MAHPHAELAQRAYEAFAKGDVAALDTMMADDVTYYISGTSAISGTYEGKQTVFAFFADLAERSGGTFEVDVHDIVANDSHTDALVKLGGERDGKRLDSENVHVMHIDDGQITSFRSFDWDQQAAREFWD